MTQRMLLTLGLLAAVSFSLTGQDYTDALRYSLYYPSGTGRSIGAGDALSALGADFSVVSTNPAGLAWMRRGEFVISPTIYYARTESALQTGEGNESFTESDIKFAIPNFGVVFASRPYRNPRWRTLNFGLGMNRLTDFNSQYFYQGQSVGSIVDRFQELANGFAQLDAFEAGLAVDAEALYQDPNNPNDPFYFSDFDGYEDVLLAREQTIMRSGSVNELVFTLAGNYEDRFLWGLTLGVPFVDFEESKEYREDDPQDQVPPFESLTFTENKTATGAGVNLKLGFIYRVNQAVRLGAAVHTPSLMQLSEQFSTRLDYNFYIDNELISNSAESGEGSFQYQLITPWRFIGGLGLVLGKSGFVSGDVEYVNYAGNRFSYDGFSQAEQDANDGIDNNLQSAVLVRVGGEYVLGPARLRAGLGVQPSPLVAEGGDKTTNTVLSLGAGYRGESFFVDLGFRRSSREDQYVPYLTSEAPQQLVNTTLNNNQLVFSLGFKF